MRTKDDVQALLSRVLSRISAPQAQVEYDFSASLTTRFAEGAITQNRSGEEESLRVIVSFGTRQGSSIINSMDDASLERVAERAQTIALAAPQDPEFVPPLGPQSYPVAQPRFDPKVAQATPAALADHVAGIVKRAKAQGFVPSGLMSASSGVSALATTLGLFGYDQHSKLSLSTTMHGAHGSGYAAGASWRAEDIAPEEIAGRAAATAHAAQNPRALEPGDYTVILEPLAVAELLLFTAMSLGAREGEEGSTVFAGTLGTEFFSSRFTLTTEIDDPRLPAPPFSDDGLPSRRIVWVEDGVVRRLHHTRYWAHVKNESPDPSLFPLCIGGDDRSVEDLVGSCHRGLLVKRLWYIRYVDRKELLLTGMTRDGLFLIENGVVTGPVKNLRFNESPVTLFKNIVGLSRPEYVNGSMRVPAVMSEGFTFSSVTESV
ncbi:TldD/PmbA family protein [Candidatus Fermentibacteria bacterium]|nr:TldD/PmbA family protein [Candidatus Fermentibacteria bacterium]